MGVIAFPRITAAPGGINALRPIDIQIFYEMSLGLYLQNTPGWHGIDRIQNNVNKHLRELRFVPFDQRKVRLQIQLSLNLLEIRLIG